MGVGPACIAQGRTVHLPPFHVHQLMSIDRASSETGRLRSRARACLCAKIADDHRGRDTVVLDLTRITPIVDFFVLSTGTSRRQMQAIARDVQEAFAERGQQHHGIEGLESGSWLLMDYGDVVLHLFTEETRSTYDLERLWADAERVDWQAELGPPEPPA